MVKYSEYTPRGGTVLMDKILIELKGTQRFGREKDAVELTTFGTFRDDGRAYVIRYTEEQEPPEAPVKVTVKVKKDLSSVEMVRLGTSHSSLFIEKSKRNLCSYNTEFGNMLMGIYGKEIEADFDKNGGLFSFEYDIDFNGSVSSQNRVDLSYKIKSN